MLVPLLEFMFGWGGSTGAGGPLVANETFLNVLGGNYKVWMQVTSTAGDIVSQQISSGFTITNVPSTHYQTTAPLITITP